MRQWFRRASRKWVPGAVALSFVLPGLLIPGFILLSGCAGCANGAASVTPSPSPSPSASPSPTASPAHVPSFTYKVIHTYPHDRTAFTEGIFVDGGVFYESTGLRKESTLRKTEIESGTIDRKISIPDQYFGEGLASLNGKLYQLTWEEKVGFIYERDTFKKIGEFHYEGEGWGLTTDGKYLIMDNGSENIYFRDPDTFEIKRTIQVMDGGLPVKQLNELEYIDGVLYANIWQTNAIYKIDPATGKVTGHIDMTGILPDSDRQADTDVLNGIAYDPDKKRIFVTGKKWPKIFEIQLVPN